MLQSDLEGGTIESREVEDGRDLGGREERKGKKRGRISIGGDGDVQRVRKLNRGV